MEKEIFRDISYGMYLVTASNDKNVGCIINTLTQLTSENITISICLNKENYTHKVISQTKKFAVSLLSEKTDANLISLFGFKSSKDTDKFASVSYTKEDNLPIITSNMNGYLICQVENMIDVGTHTLFIAKVIKAKKVNNYSPMTYQYYHEVIKGKAPKKAPTYIEEEVKEAWVCDTCGYVHKGPLPDNFVCPICGVSREHFQKK